jgi:hypothetical protein
MGPVLCGEVLEFSERTTSHDTETPDGNVRFLRTCDLVAGHFCIDCKRAVCEHHRWAHHEGHQVREA